MKPTITLLVASMVLAYGANGYVDIDKLDRHDTASPTTSTKPKRLTVKQTKRRVKKHARARTPEALIRMQTRTSRHVKSRHLRWYDGSWSTPEALLTDAARPHRYFKRGWVLAYRYDQASFVDRYGYRYDGFDRYGFTFEGYYFRYNARYRYRDRVRGRGYFDRFYYAPLRARYYGFCR